MASGTLLIPCTCCLTEYRQFVVSPDARVYTSNEYSERWSTDIYKLVTVRKSFSASRTNVPIGLISENQS